MHPVAIAATILGLCVLLGRACKHCAANQRSVFLDRDRGRVPLVATRFAYQALPTTIV
jgi:hypothetical protein